MEREVTYEDVVTYKDKPEVLLIDVREPVELKETGVIPSSINIPMADLTNSLQIQSNEEFKNKYGRDLPSKDTELVFTCKIGARAGRAMDAAIKLGFTNSKVYKGSWKDWAAKNQAF